MASYTHNTIFMSQDFISLLLEIFTVCHDVAAMTAIRTYLLETVNFQKRVWDSLVVMIYKAQGIYNQNMHWTALLTTEKKMYLYSQHILSASIYIKLTSSWKWTCISHCMSSDILRYAGKNKRSFVWHLYICCLF